MAAPPEEMLEFAQKWVSGEIDHIQHQIRLANTQQDRLGPDADPEKIRFLRQFRRDWESRLVQAQIVRDELIEGLADYVTFAARGVE